MGLTSWRAGPPGGRVASWRRYPSGGPVLGDLRAAPPGPMTPEQAVAIMTIQERESFLAEARVGVLGVAAGSGRGPVLVPAWYHYRPGRELTVLTGRGSRKAALVRAAGQISLCPDRAASLPVRLGRGTGHEDRGIGDPGGPARAGPPVPGPRRRQPLRRINSMATPDIIAIQMLPRHWLAVNQRRRQAPLPAPWAAQPQRTGAVRNQRHVRS